MSQVVLSGEPAITVNLRRSSRARRLSLRVSRLDGRVSLTLPRGVAAREAMGFARDREDWIRGQLAQRPAALRVEVGAVLPVEGAPVTLVAGKGRSTCRSGAVLSVPGARAGACAEAYCKYLARARLATAVATHAGRIGCSPGRLTLRDTRSRWGSCSAAGDLMFSWRLILAPGFVLDYVAAHEVAHLRRMDHSPAFWALVARLFPEHRTARAWLRAEGETLHRYRFRD